MADNVVNIDGEKYRVKNTTVGELKVGDYVVSEQGKPVEIVESYDKHIPATSFDVYDEEGNSITASGNHLWYVITSEDKASHHERVKYAQKVLAPMVWENSFVYNNLMSWADGSFKEGEVLETSVMDVLALLHNDEYVDTSDPVVMRTLATLARIADSVGPVSENKVTYQDFAFGDEEVESISHVDARAFAQQVLAIAHDDLRTRWPVRVGKVIDTDTMSVLVNAGIDVYIPE